MYKILYIEDNPHNLRLVKKILIKAGYDVLEAKNGELGLEVTRENNPDLILMDINLPDIDGIEVTRRIKADKNLRHIPIVALTANAMYGDREHLISEGCDGYLAKPILRSELVRTVSGFLAQ